MTKIVTKSDILYITFQSVIHTETLEKHKKSEKTISTLLIYCGYWLADRPGRHINKKNSLVLKSAVKPQTTLSKT